MLFPDINESNHERKGKQQHACQRHLKFKKDLYQL
jgi:hypothetical protein